jgi:hypothetical protein
MKSALEVLLTAFVLATMYGAMPSPSSPTGNAVAPARAADVVTIADGTDPMPICRRCK